MNIESIVAYPPALDQATLWDKIICGGNDCMRLMLTVLLTQVNGTLTAGKVWGRMKGNLTNKYVYKDSHTCDARR